MKVAITRPDLLAALEKVSKVSPTSKSVPILNYVLVEARDDNSVSFTGTDMMSSLVVIVEALVKESGFSLLPVHDLLSAIRSTTAQGVALVTQDEGLLTKAGPTTWLWKTPLIENFPKIVDVDAVVTHTLPRHEFVQALRDVRSAVARTTYSPGLDQVCLRKGHVLASDGIRYHSVEVPQMDLLDIALPLTFVDELVALLTGSTQMTIDLGVAEDKGAVVVKLDGSILSTRTKQEEFPDVTSAFLVPAMANHHTLEVSREDLRGAVRRVRILSDPETSAVHLVLSGSKFSVMDVASQSRSGASASERIAGQWSGADRRVTVHHEYLTHLLSLFRSETLTIRLGDDAKHKPSPLLITEPGRSGVLTQLRVDWQK